LTQSRIIHGNSGKANFSQTITLRKCITNGKGIIPEGTRIPIPNNKMKWDEGNPTGHGIIIFIGTQGQVYCYVTHLANAHKPGDRPAP
jgi:hypothetical protein